MTPIDSYLVVADISLSADLGAHITVQRSLYWVTAASKKLAAAGCVRHIKSQLGFACFGVKIETVVSSEQWGTAYFACIDVTEG